MSNIRYDKRVIEAVDSIVDDIAGRKGLGDIWDGIDSPIKREIKKKWCAIISKLTA